MFQSKSAIQAITVIDIDPSLGPFSHEQQKWLTSIELVQQPPKDRNNSKHFAIIPGIFIVLSFCEKNKDPIYEIEFNSKPGSDFNIVKCLSSVQSSIGAYLCYKTEGNFCSEPISDVDLLEIQRKNRNGQSKEILNVPHSYKLISHQLPFGYLIYRKVKNRIEQTFKAVLKQKYLSPKAERINFSQLPLFCFPDGIKIVKEIRGFLTFNFVFTLQTAERIFVTCLIFKQTLDEAKKEKLEIFSDEQLFYEKALCLVSSQCFTDQFGECLQHFYRLSMSKSDIPFWRVVQTFVNEMLMPEENQIGDIGISYCYGGNKIDFHTNHKYPHISERALYSVFKFMSVENIISVFQSLLLQRKVFFVSQSKTILGYATQAFLGFLYPFRWQQVLIPILPSTLRDYLTAPVPLVAGITPSLVDSSIEADSVIVYLDKNQILNDEDNPPLPDKLFKQLLKRLQKFEIYDPAEVTEYLQNPQSTYLFKMQEVNDPQFHGYLVRDSFYEFLLTLMKNYRKYMSKPKVSTSDKFDTTINSFDPSALMSNIFKVQDFLSDLGMTKIGSFGYKFTESSIFTSFIERSYQNQNDSQILFFDGCIERKKSKKQNSFIFPITNKKYRVIKNAEAIAEDSGPFFYKNFPSILKDSAVKEQEIQIVIVDQKQEENKLVCIIEEQFQINKVLFQSGQNHDDQIYMKMLSLLLNKNKAKLQVEPKDNKIQFYSWFLSLYEKQVCEIEFILSEWPSLVCEETLETIGKQQFIKNNRKIKQGSFVGVCDGGNYQMIFRRQIKLFFVEGGSGCKGNLPHGGSLIKVEVLSHQLKQFLNRILKKQGGYFLDFCEKKAAKDVRASTLKKASEQVWNIQTILEFKSWLHSEKQFATGLTHD